MIDLLENENIPENELKQQLKTNKNIKLDKKLHKKSKKEINRDKCGC